MRLTPDTLGQIIDLGGDPNSIIITIDGERCDHCVEADDIEGWARTLVKDPGGGFAIADTGEGPMIIRVIGAVMLSWSPA